jgi:hypothetical protein
LAIIANNNSEFACSLRLFDSNIRSGQHGLHFHIRLSPCRESSLGSSRFMLSGETPKAVVTVHTYLHTVCTTNHCCMMWHYIAQQAGLSAADIDVFEINEAFASQAVFCVRELGIDINKVCFTTAAVRFHLRYRLRVMRHCFLCLYRSCTRL